MFASVLITVKSEVKISQIKSTIHEALECISELNRGSFAKKILT